MKISPEKFIEWCENHEDRFGQIIVHGNEVRLNTIFPTPSGREDHDHVLWCNPYGGKKNANCGVFHCWKSGAHGSLISLVMLCDSCDFETAAEILGGQNVILRNLEKKLKEFFENRDKKQEEEVANTLDLPPFSSLITELPVYNYHRVQAEVYLFNRKLPTDGLYITTGGGQYRHRIIIPYFRDNKLIYFNSRYIGNLNNIPKYLGPDKRLGVGKDDVLYLPKWPKPGNKLYLTEGEFDALSIYYSGQSIKKDLYSGAFGGKNLSDKQVEMIRAYHLVLCLDTDAAGKEGLGKMAQTLQTKGLAATFVRPPKIYKDWNGMLQKVGSEALVYYLLKNEKPLNDIALLRLLS